MQRSSDGNNGVWGGSGGAVVAAVDCGGAEEICMFRH
jgi:hypothetical protein